MEKKRILIVDDEIEVTDYLKEYFNQRGFEVLTAVTGEEGLNLLISMHPSVVLLDIRLKESLSGVEVLRRAKARNTAAQIIMLTAVEDRNVAELARGLGAADYLTKPFVLRDLEEIVLSRLKA